MSIWAGLSSGYFQAGGFGEARASAGVDSRACCRFLASDWAGEASLPGSRERRQVRINQLFSGFLVAVDAEPSPPPANPL